MTHQGIEDLIADFNTDQQFDDEDELEIPHIILPNIDEQDY